MNPSEGPSLGTRLRSALNVRVRLMLLFALLLATLGGMAQLFNSHIQQSRVTEIEFQQAQEQLRIYSEAQDSVMQFRVFLLRAVLYTTVAPDHLDEELANVRASELRMHEKLSALARIDTKESESLRLLLPQDPVTALGRVRDLVRTGKRAEFSTYLVSVTANFNKLQDRLNLLMQRNRERTDAAAELSSSLHEQGLTAYAYLVVMLLLTSLLLTYLALRNVVASLSRTMTALHAIPAKTSSPAAGKVMGDEFDQMAHALEQLRTSTVELNRAAYVHPLTGLPNNVKLGSELEGEIGQARQLNTAIALLFVDLNDFRAVNDAIGHDTGDACLRELGQRLRTLTAPRDAVFHFSGDLFALYLTAPADEVRLLASTLAGRVHAAILQPVEAAGRSLRLTASISIALFPEHADDARGLIGAADAAVHVAKRQGRDNTQWANRELAVRADHNLKLTEDIQRGLKAGEFIPYYEPIVDMQTDRVVGAEALLRWNHPREGILRPARFLDVAEQTGQLYPMTAHAFRTACVQFAKWPTLPYLTFNLSPRQIRPALASTVRRILQETGLAPERLEFEITENALMDRVEQVAQILNEARDLGLRLSLDDFGTGYSSLNYLQRLPVNKLKIDRSFVSRLDNSRASQAIINAMLSIARNLHLEVVAEGVETQHQLDILCAMGCRYVQGYLFSPAMPAEEFAEWIKMSPTQHLARAAAV